MKKLLLLLSCCLATWCSVQAGAKYSASSSEVSGMFQETSASNVMLSSPAAATSSGPGQITSFSYKEKESKIYITYKTNNATSASVNLLSGGRIVNSSPISIPVSNSGSRTEAISVASNWPEAMYVVLLYVNGSVKGQISYGSVGPCYSVNVNVNAWGDIKTVTPVNTRKVTVNYILQHGSTANSSMRIYDGTKLLCTKSLSNTNVNTYQNVTLEPNSFLEYEKKYTCKLYTGNKVLDSLNFKIAAPQINGEIWAIACSYDKTVEVDYILNNAQNASMNIYDYDTNEKLLPGNGVSISNSSTEKKVIIKNVPLKSYHRYYVKITAQDLVEKDWSIRENFNSEIINGDAGKVYTNKIENLSYVNNRISVDFTIQKIGSNVGFKLINTRTGATYRYDRGQWQQNTGNDYITIPENGTNTYVVVLVVNNTDSDGRQILVTR